MFRIDEERVIDATRAGSIAHLINHSCEVGIYSYAFSTLFFMRIFSCLHLDIA